MNTIVKDPLLATGRIITLIAQALLAVGALGCFAAAVVIPFARDSITSELREEFDSASLVFPASQVTGLMILAVVVLILTFVFFKRLRAVIDTVGLGDPFQHENARRLTDMAWLMLAAQIMSAIAAFVGVRVILWLAQYDDELPASVAEEIDWVDFGSVVLVIVLFILARVFRHGAAMRDDLEGTV
ncbi:MAG: DUF2975 domain-containing protein [Pontixanthobacter sp.]